jgi:stage V sporulation protein AF
VCSFATPSIEFSSAIRLFRYVLFFATVIAGWWGMGIGFLLILLTFGLTKSFGIPYLWPLVPFDGSALMRIIFRYPIPYVGYRPRLTKPEDIKAKGEGRRQRGR